jgi:hypothetical protein
MIPDTLARTTSRGDELRLVVRSWTILPQLPAGQALSLPQGVDTILVERDGASRLRYLVRPSTPLEMPGDSLLQGFPEGDDPVSDDELPDSVEPGGFQPEFDSTEVVPEE